MKSPRANITERLDQQDESIKEMKEMIIGLNCTIDKFTIANNKNMEVPKTVSVCLCANKLKWSILIVNWAFLKVLKNHTSLLAKNVNWMLVGVGGRGRGGGGEWSMYFYNSKLERLLITWIGKDFFSMKWICQEFNTRGLLISEFFSDPFRFPLLYYLF